MRLGIRGQLIAIDSSLRQHAERRLRLALSRFASPIRPVSVRTLDMRGTRDGVDNSCRITVNVLPKGRVAIQETQHDWYLAIDRAPKRASRAIARDLSRQLSSQERF